MSHKVHPKSFRIRRTKDWDSRGFYEKDFPSYLEEDFKIRKFLEKKIGKLGVEKIEIERSSGKVNIIISTARPGLIIGRGGEGVEKLKRDLENSILNKKKSLWGKKTVPSSKSSKKSKTDLKIEIREIRNPWTSASLVGQWMAGQIERRVRYRRVLKRSLSEVMAQKGVKGARVEVKGRLDGIEISRREWLKEGRLPRQTIRAHIDYAYTRAYCSYGVVGIKVWIYKGERKEVKEDNQ